MNIVEENGGLHNTVAMELFDIGYSECSDSQRELVNARVSQLGQCPKCGEQPTYQTPDGTFWDSNAHYWRAGLHAGEQVAMSEDFQARVYDWMRRCFLRPDGLTREQRAFRFIEEAIELAQATGTSREDVLRLVDYVYSRPEGLIIQELGGVMVTLAGVASSYLLNLNACAEAELRRCEAKTDRIRQKDLEKPQRSPLPGPTSTLGGK